jgi:peptidoglycan/xylan/chitin deacetylase (PgdA/CDA1 family)
MITPKRRLLIAAAWVVSQLRSKGGLRILTYHEVSRDKCGRWEISESALEEHLRYIRDSGYRTVRIAHILNNWQQILAEPRVVAITFDDGVASHRDLAANLLAKYGMTATFFVPTSYIQDQRCSSGWLKNTMMSWGDLKSLQDSDFEIGSHSRTHAALGTSSLETARDEIAGSKLELEDHLGTEIVSFSYPYGTPGAYTSQTRELVAASGYRAACTQTPGPIRAASDQLELPRMGMAGTDSVRVLEMNLRGGFDFLRLVQRHPD